MSPPIVELLRAGGVPLPSDGSAWRQLLLVHNVGGVPGGETEDDTIDNRGFNLLVVNDASMPTYFCKFRPKLPSQPSRSSLTARLSRVPELSSVLPATWNIYSDDIEAEVSRYLDGELLQLRIRSMDQPTLRSALAGVLAAAAKISLAATRVEPSLVAGSHETELSEAGAWALQTLKGAGFSSEVLEPLGAALERAGAVPRIPQHGDLWPRNVLDSGDRWSILDLEFYGRIQVPLYDAMHLVRTSWDARHAWRTSGPAWIDELVSHSGEGRAYQDILIEAGRSASLSTLQIGGALVYYIADMGARLFYRRIASEDVEPFLLEVRRLSDWLLSGRRAEDLLLSAR